MGVGVYAAIGSSAASTIASVSGAADIKTRYMHGAQIAGVAAVVGGRADGLEIAGAATVAHDVDGVRVAGATTIAGDARGAQIAGGVTIAERIAGLQLAGGANIAEAVR